MKASIKEKLIKKQDASGVMSMLLGIMILTLFIMIMHIHTSYDANIKLAQYTEDGLSAALLGAALPNIQEYGLSTLLVINDNLVGTSTGITYRDIVSIPLNGTPNYHTAYNKKICDLAIVKKGNLGTTVTDNTLIDRKNKFLDILKTNLQLNDDFTPSQYSAYFVRNCDGVTNKVNVECFKVYNYYEWVEVNPDPAGVETGVLVRNRTIKPRGAATGGITVWNKTSSSAIYNSWHSDKGTNSLEGAGIIHTCIVELSYNISSDKFTVTNVYNDVSDVYVTNESNEKILNDKGEPIKVSETTLYAKISFLANLGKSGFGVGNQYIKVYQDKTVSIDTNLY